MLFTTSLCLQDGGGLFLFVFSPKTLTVRNIPPLQLAGRVGQLRFLSWVPFWHSFFFFFLKFGRLDFDCCPIGHWLARQFGSLVPTDLWLALVAPRRRGAGLQGELKTPYTHDPPHTRSGDLHIILYQSCKFATCSHLSCSLYFLLSSVLLCCPYVKIGSPVFFSFVHMRDRLMRNCSRKFL